MAAAFFNRECTPACSRTNTFEHGTAVNTDFCQNQFFDSVASTAVLIRVLGITNSTLDYLLKHPGTAMRLKLERIESLVGIHTAHQIRQGANFLGTDPCVFVA
jgi:hypothetical protein